MTYEQTISWLYGLEGKLGMDFRLERLGPVLDRLDHPENAFSALHVAGTNGKGSTSAMLHAIFGAAGMAAGLYTSPHLHSFRERIRVGDRRISRGAVVRHVADIREASARVDVELTYFEITTIAAFMEFRRTQVPIAVVEVGLGGRLDATNIVRSACSVITSIGLDHTAFLGDTLAEVAAEKAGIIKRGVPVVTGPLPPEALAVIEQRANTMHAPLAVCGRDFDVDPGCKVALRGRHQLENAAVARAAVGALGIDFPVSTAAIDCGLAEVCWPGRLEDIAQSPRVIVDSAHNPHATAVLVSALEDLAASRPRILVFGVMADKDWRGMLDILVARFDHIVFVPVSQKRALAPSDAREYLSEHRCASVAASVVEGLNEATGLAGSAGTVVVTGSIFLVGEAGEVYGVEGP